MATGCDSAAKLYIKEMSWAIAIALAFDKNQVKFLDSLIEELANSRFLDSWSGCVP